MDLEKIVFGTPLGVATKGGLLLVKYDPKAILMFQQIKHVSIYKKNIRMFEYLGYLLALFLVAYSYFFYTHWLFFSCFILSSFLVFYVSRFIRIKKYALVLTLSSGEHLKIRLRKDEIHDAKRLIKHVRKNKH